MKIHIKNLPLQPNDFLRRAGYGQHRDRRASEPSWTKRLSSDFYPRYHAYARMTEDGFIINLHLDQKKPSYAGTSAHAGEYEGPVVEREASRLREVEEKMRAGRAEQKKDEEKAKGFFRRLFGG